MVHGYKTLIQSCLLRMEKWIISVNVEAVAAAVMMELNYNDNSKKQALIMMLCSSCGLLPLLLLYEIQ